MVQALQSNSGRTLADLKTALGEAFLLSDDAQVLSHGRIALLLDKRYRDTLGHVVALDKLDNTCWTQAVKRGVFGNTRLTEDEFEWLMCQYKQAEQFYNYHLDLESALC